MGGVATVTEVSTIGIVYCLMAGIFYGSLEWSRMKSLLIGLALVAAVPWISTGFLK